MVTSWGARSTGPPRLVTWKLVSWGAGANGDGGPGLRGTLALAHRAPSGSVQTPARLLPPSLRQVAGGRQNGPLATSQEAPSAASGDGSGSGGGAPPRMPGGGAGSQPRPALAPAAQRAQAASGEGAPQAATRTTKIPRTRPSYRERRLRRPHRVSPPRSPVAELVRRSENCGARGRSKQEKATRRVGKRRETK